MLYGHLLNVCISLGTSEKQMSRGLLQEIYWGAHPWRKTEGSWRRQRRPSDDEEVLTLVKKTGEEDWVGNVLDYGGVPRKPSPVWWGIFMSVIHLRSHSCCSKGPALIPPTVLSDWDWPREAWHQYKRGGRSRVAAAGTASQLYSPQQETWAFSWLP